MDEVELDALLRQAERYAADRPELLPALARAYSRGDPVVRGFVHAVLGAEIVPAREAEALRRRFGLTRQEARVALHLAAGGSVATCAERLGIAVSTVRTHLKAVFAKTHVSRQAQLAALFRRIREEG